MMLKIIDMSMMVIPTHTHKGTDGWSAPKREGELTGAAVNVK